MEVSEFELARILKIHTGQDADLGNGPLSVRAALAHAANLLTQGMTPEVSRKAAALVKRFMRDNGSVCLEAEEVVSLKKNAAQSLAPYVYDQIHDILEPPAKPILEEIPKAE